jgi:DUF4097 and DUF4098 domain-containing protein YvlB
MVSRRGIVIIILIGLAVIVGSTRPWVSGYKLLGNKFSSMHGPNFDMGGNVYREAQFKEDFSAAGIRRVVIKAPNGNIEVTKTDSNNITVEGERIAYGATVAEAENRLPLVQLHTRTRGDVLEITGKIEESVTRGTLSRIDMVIHVPAGIEVDSTLSLGNITLDGIEGAIRAKLSMGEVKANSIKGDLDITLSTGSISVNGATIAKKLNLTTSMGSIDFSGTLGESNYIESSVGSVKIRVPRSICMRIDAETSTGRINSSLPVTNMKSETMGSSASGILGEGMPTGEIKIRVSMGEILISGM